MRNKIGLLLFSVLVLLSCNKANGDNKTADSSDATTLLTAKPWKNYKVQSRTNGGAWTGVTIPDCQMDDLKWFEKNGDVVRDKGVKRCPGENDPNKATEATWKWNNEHTVIITTASQGAGIINNKVEKLEEGVMILSSNIISDGVSHEYLMEFRH